MQNHRGSVVGSLMAERVNGLLGGVNGLTAHVGGHELGW